MSLGLDFLRRRVLRKFLCSATRFYLNAPIQSATRMTPHEQRLIALAHVLMIPGPNYVVRALRSKNVMYFDHDGSLLFDPAPQWSDERLVEAAARLFLLDVDGDPCQPEPGART